MDNERSSSHERTANVTRPIKGWLGPTAGLLQNKNVSSLLLCRTARSVSFSGFLYWGDYIMRFWILKAVSLRRLLSFAVRYHEVQHIGKNILPAFSSRTERLAA
jgi:hypothetical protein